MKKLLMLLAVFALALPLAGCPKPATTTTPSESADEALRRAFANEHVLFDFDRSNVRADQVAVVEAKAAFLSRFNVNAELQGYADERGTEAYNLALSDRRAKSVKEYLGTLGISGGRLTTIGYGEANPISTGTSEDAYQLNRRVQSVIR